MTHNDSSKLDVLYERITHIIQSLEAIDRKVTDQNHSVAEVKKWIAVHEEQAQRRSQHISENEGQLSLLKLELQPILAFTRYPLAFGLGVLVLFISAIAGIYTSIISLV